MNFYIVIGLLKLCLGQPEYLDEDYPMSSRSKLLCYTCKAAFVYCLFLGIFNFMGMH